MKMFHWNDLDSCANYARGDAIVMAENEDSARIKLREALQAWMAENREWQWLHGDEESRGARGQDRVSRHVFRAGRRMASLASM